MRRVSRADCVRAGDGFTLLEVIVAMAILSIAVVAAIEGFAQGLRLLKVAGDHQRATLYADEKLREVVAPREGHDEDEDRDAGFSWERVVTAVDAPDLAGDGSRPAAWRAWHIVVRVRFGERRQVEIATLRTTPVTQEDSAGSLPPATATTTGVTIPGATRSGPTPSAPSASRLPSTPTSRSTPKGAR